MTGPTAVAVVGGRYVQAPTDLPAVSDAALTLWLVHVWLARGEPTHQATQDQLHDALGRTGDDPGHITRVNRELQTAGLLSVERIHQSGKTRNRYTVLGRVRPGDRRAWVDIPASALVALAAGAVKPCHVAALYRWMVTCRGEDRWTPETGAWTAVAIADQAAEWGQAVRTVSAHRSHLVAVGLLEVRIRPGRAPLTAAPGQLPEVEAPLQRMSDHPGNGCRVTPANDPGNGCRSLVPKPDVPSSGPFEDQNPPSVPVGTDLTAVSARGRTDAAPPRGEEINSGGGKLRTTRPAPKPTGSAGPSPEAWRVLGRLPRAWRECPTWVRQRLAERIDRALNPEPVYLPVEIIEWHLSRGLGHKLRQPQLALTPDVIVDAVARYAPTPDGDGTGSHTERHTRALDALLVLALGDAKGGQDRAQPEPVNPVNLLATSADECVSCGGADAPLRDDLPVPVPVCDPCMADALVGAAA